MQTIRIQLRESTQETVELRYWLPKIKHYESRRLKLAEIADFLKQGERNYYRLLPNLPGIGKQLFFWLDGDGRWLSRGIANCRGEGLVIAIDTDQKLAHLPWEVLHDGEDFLVKRVNPVVLPLRWIEKETEAFSVEPRQLRVLFMATDPEDVEPKLEFEQEEARILGDTQDFAVDLRVEESGCVSELGKVWSRYLNDFDVFHLTGHASIKDEAPYTPYFITETEIGDRHETTAAELAEVFRFRFPKLVFLSGCRTGQAPDKGAVPSMAEALIAQGAIAVLSWGRPVEDRTATAAAAHLYGKLAAGYQLAEALASTYQQLFKQNVRDWHLLRLYVQGECPGALVEVLGDVPPSAPEPAYQQFLDPDTQLVRVAKPSEFVGRRRTLQRCLKAIRTSLGVLIHGLGGVGKSTVTARLLERMVGYDRLVNFRQLDEDKLLKTLAEQCTSERGHEILNGKLPLMQRLTKFFTEGLNTKEQRFAFVLDDFEANLDLRNGVYVLQPQVVDVLLALLKAMQNSQLPHKVIITCRYNFTLSELNHRLYREPLGALGGADLIKKYNRLDSFNGSWQFQPDLPERAKQAADGNPRLLEWLDKILQNSPKSPEAERGVEIILQKMAEKEKEFREDILAQELLKQQTPGLRKMLGKLLVYELPVVLAAISPICEDISSWESHIQRAEILGLLEVTLTNNTERLYRVPRILSPLLENPKGEELYKQAAQILYRLWWEAGSATEAQKLEIHRLGLLGKDEDIAGKIAISLAGYWRDQSRFREAIHLCKSTLEITKNYSVLREIAYCEHQMGEVERALNYYEQALNLCPAEDEQELAAIYYFLGILKADKGEVDEALALYNQSLEINERVGNVQGKAATLQCLAIIYANKGEVDEALALYNQSLEIDERIGNVKGKAARLHQLAGIYADKGEVEQAIALYNQSLEIFERIGNVQGKAATLQCLAGIHANKGEVEQAITLYNQSLEIEERIGNVKGKAATLHSLATIYANKGEVDEAIALYNQSLEIEERIGNVKGKATTLHQLGILYANKGEVDEAIALYNQSLEIEERIGNVKGKAATLHSLAIIYANKGEVEQAIALYNQSLEIFERIGNIQGKGTALHNLAGISANKGEVDEAIALYNQSLEIEERIGNVQGKAATLHQLAGIYANKGEVDEAIKLYNLSLEIEEGIGNIQGKAATLHQLAGIYADKGDVDEAIALYNLSLEIKEPIGDVQAKAATLNNLGIIYANKGDVDKAIALYNQSLEIFEHIGNVQGKAATLHCLGYIYAYKGEVDEAIALYNQVLEIDERSGNVQGKAATLDRLGNLYANKGEVDEAITLFNQSLEIKERIGDIRGKAATLYELGYIYAYKGEVDEAIALFNQSLEITERIGDVQGKAITLWWLGGLAEQQGEYTKAISYLQPALEILQRLQSPDAESVSASLDRVIRNSNY
ncbi:tetratricopeptide repeat protein [Nostoc sp. NMS8]|uniref:tetratricopeptide repeat protein n=1 Tax=Nostoc sp. NMS8 TaxID=2815392 RepID=UPI0025D80E9E|nr:tetratricopeptide repeat protein [Nostoc sp. NMS8]MBN3959037.1 tetratricopeptide repeat protein [Nostoc sp. NMS8]